MTTLLTPKLTLNYLAYLGYSSSPATDHPAVSALHITRPRKQDRRQNKVARNVFLCYVLGATGSGKTSLLRRFVNKRSGDGLGSYEPTTKVLSVVNSVEMEGREKYLVVSRLSAPLTTVARVWEQVRVGDPAEYKESRSSGYHHLRSRLFRYEFILIHLQS